MPDIPLPKGFTGMSNFPKKRESLINLFLHPEGITRTAGIELFDNPALSGECRGGATWYVDGRPYFVIGTQLVRVNADGNLEALGVVAGSAECIFSSGQIDLVVIVKGGNGYTYNLDSGFSQITDSAFFPSVSVAFIDGRHVYIPSDGEPAFYSEVDQAGVIDGFVDAEELPDINKAVINIQNQCYILGTDSTQPFRGTSDVNTPLIPRGGGRVDVGFKSGLIKYSNTFAFIGKLRDQSFAVYAMGSGKEIKISNSAIAELINSYTDSELESIRADRFTHKDVEFVCWHLPNETIAFTGGNWVFLDSLLNGDRTSGWSARGICFADNRYYCGSRSDAKIGNLTLDPSEYGEDVEYQLQSFIRSQKDSNFSVKSMELNARTGQDNTTVGLSLSRDARLFSDFHYRTMHDMGEYNHRVRWAGGLGRYDDFCGFKIRGTGNIQFDLEALQFD